MAEILTWKQLTALEDLRARLMGETQIPPFKPFKNHDIVICRSFAFSETAIVVLDGVFYVYSNNAKFTTGGTSIVPPGVPLLLAPGAKPLLPGDRKLHFISLKEWFTTLLYTDDLVRDSQNENVVEIKFINGRSWIPVPLEFDQLRVQAQTGRLRVLIDREVIIRENDIDRPAWVYIIAGCIYELWEKNYLQAN